MGPKVAQGDPKGPKGPPGPWSLGPGPWSLVPGPWALGPGPWSLVPGPWSLGPGPWSLVPGPWSLGPRPWALISRYGSLISVPNHEIWVRMGQNWQIWDPRPPIRSQMTSGIHWDTSRTLKPPKKINKSGFRGLGVRPPNFPLFSPIVAAAGWPLKASYTS